jgi:hypothetical protein
MRLILYPLKREALTTADFFDAWSFSLKRFYEKINSLQSSMNGYLVPLLLGIISHKQMPEWSLISKRGIN